MKVGACWSVAPRKDFAADYDFGRECASCYLRVLAVGGRLHLPGGLMAIFSGMAARKSLDQREAGDSEDGAALGFVSGIEDMLVAAIRQ